MTIIYLWWVDRIIDQYQWINTTHQMLRFPLYFGDEASRLLESQDISSLSLASIFTCFKMEDAAVSDQLAS